MKNTTLNWSLAWGMEWVIIISCFVLASFTTNPLMWWILAIIIGTRQHALGVIGHWSLHGLIPHSGFFKWASFAPIMIDPTTYKNSHSMHHLYLGSKHDPEVEAVSKYPKRWLSHRKIDTLLDLTGVHVDEALSVLKMLVSKRSVGIYVLMMIILFLFIGPLSLLWPAGMVGSLAAHRLRARTEHSHLILPGKTFKQGKPALWKRVLFLPHYTWLHFEHHENVRKVVWEKT